VKVHPVVLDTRPAYLGRSQPASLLLMPLGRATLLDQIHRDLRELPGHRLTVVSPFEPTPAYEAAVKAACPAVEGVVYAQELAGQLSTFEPSDWLFMIDPRCYPAHGFPLQTLFEERGDAPHWSRHLLALEANPAGTRECVEFDPSGRVRRIQRYYDGVTWTFAKGVCSSLLPASCAMMLDVPFTSLPQLRSALATRGVPSHDIPLVGPAFDLMDERELLRYNERLIVDLDLPDRQADVPVHQAPGATVHPTAQFLGPVVVQEDAQVEAGATVIGPALVAAGARVGAGAVVAQCLVGPGVTVEAGSTTRHRLLLPGRVGQTVTATYDPRLGLDQDAVTLREEERPASDYLTGKAVVEGAIALVSLLILSPLLLLLAVLVKLESKGPVLYGDKREGKGRQQFRCWKFRTMRVGAAAMQRELMKGNQMDGPQFKMTRDPRVTRLGRFLRAVSLDELPQLLNVAVGHMSLVGPRPSPFRENQMCIPWREARLSVRPGITGLWQVCRHERSTGDFHQWIYYDLLYVRHMSPWVDLKILLATLYTLGGKGHVPLAWIIPSPRIEKAGRPLAAAVRG
jgi:lipopolysaccharide/colanic/teichoic acid biosynthesis glycosyltransferase